MNTTDSTPDTNTRSLAWYSARIADAQRDIATGQDINRRANIIRDGLMLAYGEHMVMAAFATERQLKAEQLRLVRNVLRVSDVEVVDEEYRFNHGAAPRWRGAWAFHFATPHAEAEFVRNDAGIMSMTYAKARTIAVRMAVARGVDTIYVAT